MLERSREMETAARVLGSHALRRVVCVCIHTHTHTHTHTYIIYLILPGA